jgi:hypothetical protein
VDTTNGELETGLCGAGLRLAFTTGLAARRRFSRLSCRNAQCLS